MLLSKADRKCLDNIGNRLLVGITDNPPVQAETGVAAPLVVSIGGHVQADGESIDAILHEGDLALLAAKALQGSAYQSSGDGV